MKAFIKWWKLFSLTFHFFGFLDFKTGDALVGGEGKITAWEYLYKKRWGWKTSKENSKKMNQYFLQENAAKFERDRLIEAGIIEIELCNLGHDQREFMCFHDIHLNRNKFKK